MDENSEPEEGEACYDKEDDDDNINPDTDFSYIDEKIRNILGRFQKDFEGGVSLENMGAIFGGYGSFLPTYERSPRLSHPKTPQRNTSTAKSLSNLSMEGACQTQNLKAPPNAPPAGKPGYASCPSGNVADKLDSHYAQVSEKSALKDEIVSCARQKILKVRIKMGSDNKAQKKAAIYSGLGLDDSPSSSLGNSPEESGGTMMISQGNSSESPTRIFQVMTSNHVPGGVLISPLHDSLLCLLKKEKERPRHHKSIPLLNGCQEQSSSLVDESILGKGKKLNEKKRKFLMGRSEKLVELKHENRVAVENDKTLLMKKKFENEISGGNELLPNDLKPATLSNSVYVADSMKSAAMACDVYADANQSALRSRLISSDSAREDSFGSISGRSRISGKKRKLDKQHTSVEKGVVNSHTNASLDLGDNVGSKCYQNSVPLKCKGELKMKVGQTAPSHMQNKINVPSKKEKTLFDSKKKSKGSKNSGQIADLLKESLRLDVGATPKDTTSSSQGFSSGKNKIHKLKLQKDINKGQNSHQDMLETNFEQKSDQMELPVRHFQNKPKGSGPMGSEIKQNGYFDKSKEIISGRTVDNQLSVVDPPGVVPHLTVKALDSHTAAPVATASVLIQENWVLCDRCHKWRLLPFDTRPEELPEKWLCSMLNWLPGMNRCDIGEEETTKALNALYQVPVSENQKNTQNHANGTMPLVTSADHQDLDQNYSSFNSQASYIERNKKHGVKDVQKVGTTGLSMSDAKKNRQQESLKSRSLKDMSQVPVESNLIKKSIFEQKEKYPVGGETKQAKIKSKRETGLYAYNECSDSGDLKHDMKERSVVSVKKLVDQTQASSDGGSLDMIQRTSVKKRKFEDRQDSQNGHKSYVKEEISESGFRNEKKSRVSKTEGKNLLRNNGDGTVNRKTMDHLIGGVVDIIDRNQQLGKHKKNSSSQKTLGGLDSLRRDSGAEQISMAATSSSSKVSGPHKTRANFEEARGSPVESVSSSPMRASYSEKLASITRDGSGQLVQSVTEMKERVSSDFNPRSHKSSNLDYRSKDSICKISIQTKPSSRLGNSHLLNSVTHFPENGQHAVERSQERVNQECHSNALFSLKSDKVSTSQTKDSKSSADRMKACDTTYEQESLSSRKGKRNQSDVDPKGHASFEETIADSYRYLPKSSKDEKKYVGRKDLSGQGLSQSRMENQSNVKHDEFDAKSVAPCSTKGNTETEQNLVQAISNRTQVTQVKVRSGMPELSLHCEVENQQETKGHRTVPEAQHGVVSDEFPALKHPGKPGCKNGSSQYSRQHMPDLGLVRDSNARSPQRVNSSSQTATNALNDAKELRNYADRLKNSGFVFESNEIYFQAALKFLGAASLLETSNSESSRHGDMNQMQMYSTATKLCEMCAQEYERRQEMAAAALAYKCMEVAYMRVVYCKHSTSSRDRNELQATLQMVPQGESPSSSASDVDNNLNNQPTADKASLGKGNISHAGTHVIPAKNRPSFVRLLALTQDVSSAMEASRKSQTAFAAANLSLEEAQITEGIISVKKVIDFSFQDVDRLVCLVQQAMEAINHSNLGGARD